MHDTTVHREEPRPGIAYEATPAVRPVVAHPYWTLRRAAHAVAPMLVSGPRLDDRALAGISIDTRSIARGSLFVAIRGDTHDGHDWLHAAREAGACAVMVEHSQRVTGLGIPVIVVRDTREALGLLARAWRRAWRGVVVAVGGSNGKTSTKEMLRSALGAGLTVHATAGNQNNLIGVPLTILSIPHTADVAVVEVGTNAHGEIAALRRIAEPDLAVITSIGEEHLEGLTDLAGVLREELSLLAEVSLAIVPAADPLLQAIVRSSGQRIVRAGLTSGEFVARSYRSLADGRVAVVIDDTECTVPLRGLHQAQNAMLALAVAAELGVALPAACSAIGNMRIPSMRGTWETHGALTIFNDAYNANPPSMRAALDVMEQLGPTRQRVAVLGTMRELGAASDEQHDRIAEAALRSGVDIIIAVGDFASAFTRVSPDNPRVRIAAEVALGWEALEAVLAKDAIVLLKGSRGVRLEQLLPPLTTWATS